MPITHHSINICQLFAESRFQAVQNIICIIKRRDLKVEHKYFKNCILKSLEDKILLDIRTSLKASSLVPVVETWFALNLRNIFAMQSSFLSKKFLSI